MCLRNPPARPATYIFILCFIVQSLSANLLAASSENTITVGKVTIAPSLSIANPVANPDNYNTNEDIPLNIPAPGVLGNDTDADGDVISIDSYDGVTANGGIVVMNPDGSFIYTPPTNYNGNDTFSYTIDDGNLGTATTTVTIALAPINDDPLAIGDAYFTPEDNPLIVNVVANGVLDNDSDVEGNPLTISAFDATSANGGSVVMTIDGRFTYIPSPNYSGADTFNYTVSDGNGGSASAVVTITVIPINDDPIAADDFYNIDEDVPLTIVAPGVLGNDSDPENNTLIISSFNAVSAQGGVVVVNPDGSFTYTPPSNFSGVDTFNYNIDDGNGGTASAVVSFAIAPVNDDPQAVDDNYITNEDTPLNIAAPGVLSNDNDVDGDALIVSSSDATTSNGGTVFMTNDGSFTYSPPADFSGLDTFSYTADDGNGGTAIATVTIDVLPINDEPQANDDLYTTDEDIPLIIAAPGVLFNDMDLEGTLSVGVYDAVSANGGTVAMNPDGSFTYTPAANYFGIDTFNYTADDGDGGSVSAQVIVTVNPVNDNPLAEDDSYSTDEDSTLIVVAPGVFGNDSDIDGDPFTVVSFDSTTVNGGVITMNPDGTFSYDPPANFNGDDTFTYTIDDGNGGTSLATVTITVLPINDAPLALDDGYGTDQNVAISIAAPGVLANDSDIEDSLVVSSYDSNTTGGGSVVMNPDGSFVYTPANGFAGLDTFTYEVDDGNGGTATAVVTIAVDIPNSSPVAQDDIYETQEDAELIVDIASDGVIANDSDPDGNSLTVLAANSAVTNSGGQITIYENGTFEYMPPLGFVGTDTYEYTVCDNGIPNECVTAIISIDVKEGLFTFNSGFTPNGDGFNDSWTIEGISAHPDNVVKIYNRWGNLVYQVEGYNNMDKVWQGESNQGVIIGDKQVPSGSYYFLVYAGVDSKPLSGYIVLMR